jgi:hypothetical protein
MPGPGAVWATAVLSITIFYFRMTRWPGGTTMIVIPIGLLFTLWCWRLVARARRVCLAGGFPLPPSYNNARITALVLGAFSVISSVLLMTT